MTFGANAINSGSTVDTDTPYINLGLNYSSDPSNYFAFLFGANYAFSERDNISDKRVILEAGFKYFISDAWYTLATLNYNFPDSKNSGLDSGMGYRLGLGYTFVDSWRFISKLSFELSFEQLNNTAGDIQRRNIKYDTTRFGFSWLI